MPLLTRLLQDLGDLGEIEDRPHLGGWELRLKGRTFALVQGDRVWLRTDQSTRLDFTRRGSVPFAPNPNMELGRFYEVPADVLADAASLRAWTKKALAAK
jgi:TfoX/Sxy family transcriptional regulator of competence genes